MKKKILIASICNSLCTGIIASILWLAISGVNWFGFFAIDVVFLINGFLSGAIASFIQTLFKRFPIMLSLYLGNTIPLGALLLGLFFMAEPSMEAWFLLFLIGWLIISIISTVITTLFITEKVTTQVGNRLFWMSS